MATNEKRLQQKGAVSFIRLGAIAIPLHAQREFKPHKSASILAEFDLDFFGLPVVSERRGTYYLVDGQHRIAAIKEWIGAGWEDQRIECRVYTGLTEAEEADLFDRLNDQMAVTAFDRFRVRVNAKRPEECDIKRIVERERLCISRDKIPGAIGAVTTLIRIYRRANEKVLAKTLRLIRDAYGDPGFEAVVLDGIAHLVQRYDGLLEDIAAAKTLANVHGGVKGLINRAEVLHKQTGSGKAHCVAAAAVDVLNAKRGGRKLPSWWKTDEKAA